MEWVGHSDGAGGAVGCGGVGHSGAAVSVSRGGVEQWAGLGWATQVQQVAAHCADLSAIRSAGSTSHWLILVPHSSPPHTEHLCNAILWRAAGVRMAGLGRAASRAGDADTSSLRHIAAPQLCMPSTHSHRIWSKYVLNLNNLEIHNLF